MPRQAFSDIVGTIAENSPAAASTAAGTGRISGLRNYQSFTVDVTIGSPTGGALDVYLQRLVGSTWVDWLHLPQRSAAAAAIRYVIDSNSIATAPVTVGSDTTPALAAGVFACAHPGDTVRALYIAGASTSAATAVTITITGFQSAA